MGKGSNLSNNARLPTNNEALNLLTTLNHVPVPRPVDYNSSDNGDDQIKVNEFYITLWSEGRKNNWYLAYCVNFNDDGTFQMDHLHCVKKSRHSQWKYPDISDTCTVEIDQVLPVKPAGNWDSTIFNLSNADYINQEFHKSE